jgi:hypothetical protein
MLFASNPLNTASYCEYMPLIQSNNTGLAYFYYDAPNPNPITVDCSTDLPDFATFASHWLETGCEVSNNWCSGADLDHIDDVDMKDLSELCQLWLADTP